MVSDSFLGFVTLEIRTSSGVSAAFSLTSRAGHLIADKEYFLEHLHGTIRRFEENQAIKTNLVLFLYKKILICSILKEHDKGSWNQAQMKPPIQH